MNSSVPSYYSSLSPEEKANLSKVIDYNHLNCLPEVWPLAAEKFGNLVALEDIHNPLKLTFTYGQMWEQMQQVAAGWQYLGVNPGDRISLISDNSARWFIVDQGMMLAGAVNAVRSSQADAEELLYIIEDSGSSFLAVENLKTLKKLASGLDRLPIRAIALLSDEDVHEFFQDSRPIYNFTQLLELGAQQDLQPIEQSHNHLATLIYTSGTTGRPKGAMLSHGNLLHQINTMPIVVAPVPGDRILSILPSWHVYERTVEYYLLSQGCRQRYTNIRHFKTDLRDYKPQYMVGVPRIWESIYEGIQKEFRSQPESRQKLIQTFINFSTQYVDAKRIQQRLELDRLTPSVSETFSATVKATVLAPLHALADRLVYQKVREATGGEIKAVISGGGSLAKHIDKFFEIINFPILVGYGLTETSPVLAARQMHRNLRGASGFPFPATDIAIVDPETRQPLREGAKGLILARGPQIMQGYYGNIQATAKAIDKDGWFDTGDLGFITPDRQLVITGRAKDTIVLTNGENIEPQPIEDACARSPYIDQIVVLGQDQKTLGALIVPNLEALENWSRQQGTEELMQTLADGTVSLNLQHPAFEELLRQELNREVKNRPGYRPDDRIGPFRSIAEPFSIENGMMTQTLKIKRPVVNERYRDMINEMFA
ncbi:AMP-dependent synthetase/ligase [Roseofilum casamattae]|uniref:AMP-binding protein n=1 Tax=Roseofilum casamattae BLCC-M143 TaxID=3022442 RepID=A0ABT7C1X9_9CYAN|nr:AMP-binding protein [Roseofilum casamattae]MDJ1185463.1 AMP-binding protein [Roseofilum casamattae BLCC-M143]